MMKRKLLLTVAIALMSISDALAKEDVTVQYLTNADLTSLNGWTLSGSNNMKYGYYEDWKTDGDVPVIEFYHSWHWDSNVVGTPIGNSKTFRFSQKVTLPAGYYRLAVNAFYREGNGNGTNTKAYIFAGEKKQYVVGLPSSGVGAYSGSNDLYKAANAFSKGDFSNEFDFSVSEETEIEIGFDGYIDTYCSWCILGPVTLWEYTAEDYMEDYTEQVAIAEGLYDSKMNIDVLAALKEAASKGSSLVTVDDVTEAVKELKEAISAARASIADYEAIAAVNTKVALLDAAGQSVYQPFLDAYNAGTLTNEDIASVEDAYIDAFWAMTTYPPNPNTNMTPYIINPSFEFGYLGDWLSDNGGIVVNNGNFGAAKGSFFVEKWVQAPGTLTNGTLLQKLSGLPNGKYKVTAELQNREQGNGDVAGRGFFLFANSDRTEAITNNGETIEISTVVLDGSLTIGVQIEDCTGNWVCCDNFQLFFERELVVADYEDALAAAVDRAGELNGQIPTAAYSELQATVTSYNKSYDTIDEYKNAINEIDAATAAKKPLVAPYATWKGLKEAADAIVAATGNTKLQQKFTAFSAGVEATTTVEDLSQLVTLAQGLLNAYNDWMALKGKADILKEVANDKETANTAFKNAINTQTAAAVSALDEAEPDQAIAKVQAATSALKEAMITYVGAANPVGKDAQFDCTFMLTNPDLTGLPTWQPADGWGTEQTGGNSQVTTNDNATSEDGTKTIFFEYWNYSPTQENVFALYLNVTLPIGTYDMSCYAFAQGQSVNKPNGVYFYANDTQGSAVNTARLSEQSIKFFNIKEQEVKIGLKPVEGNENTWMGIGYVELHKVPTDNTPHDISIEVANAEAEATVNNVVVTATPVFSHVVLTITPNEGYYVESVTAEDADNNEVKVTSHPADGNYTFTMPAKNVNVLVTMAELDKVTMTITAAKYATFIAPFDVIIPENVTAYTVDWADDYVLTMTPVEETIPANTPVVLYADVEETFTKNCYGFSTAEADSYNVGLLTGVYTETLAPEGSYVMQNQGGHVAFYRVPEGFTKKVPANRAYLTEASTETNVFYFPGEEGGVTAIEGFDALTSGEFDAIYTASGVKVDALQKGLNIVVKGDKSYKIYVK